MKKDYSYLLDNLYLISGNYYLNSEGKIVSKSGRIETDPRMIINAEFYILYRKAYRSLIEEGSNYSIKDNNINLVEHMSADYNRFNYFINLCISEYNMYDDIGTGKVNYFPCQPLADFFFKNDVKKGILRAYLNSELKADLNKEQDKRRVKKFI